MRKPSHSTVDRSNMASTEELGIIIDELSTIRRQLTSLEATVGSVRHDMGFVRDGMAMLHETSLPSFAARSTARSTAPLMRRSSCKQRNRETTTPSLHTSSRPATVSAGKASGSNHSPSVLAKMAEEEVRKIFRTKSEQITLAKSKSTEAHGTLGCLAKSPTLVNLVKKMDGHFENVMDSVVGVVIVLNTLFLGMSADAENSSEGAYRTVNVVFSAIFWLELIIKVLAKGWRSQYCGKDRFANIFDALLILIDSIALFFDFAGNEFQNDEVNKSSDYASLFRIVRLLKLARILRLLRSGVFQDLLSMIQGMLGGLATLGWSVVLFVLFIYVVSLIFRLVLGPDPDQHDILFNSTRSSEPTEEEEKVQTMFKDLPRSMFTTFRCSFGDCTTSGGTPIFEHVTEVHGGIWSLVYSLFNFIVVIGLFNVISAIFVESTLAAAAQLTAAKHQQRLTDENRWAVNFVTLLRSLLAGTSGHTEEMCAGLSEGNCSCQQLDEVLEAEFPREDFDEVLKQDPRAKHALAELDIVPEDHKYLSDILDPDNSGTIGVLELVDGLQRLRGEPRRSDTIAIDLMVRSLQEKVDDIWRGMGCDTSNEQQVQEASAGPAGQLDLRTLQVQENTLNSKFSRVRPTEHVTALV